MKFQALIVMACFLLATPVNANVVSKEPMESARGEGAMDLFSFGEMFVLRPDQSVEGPEGLFVKHLAYGHKRLKEGGDKSFLGLEVRQGDASTTLRVDVPIQRPITTEWRDFTFHFVKCEENGPPHSKSKPVELFVTRR
ncbi:MAG: hypothetical protein ABTQ34_01935 [Bdellovibrionales bacterium]